jgi:mRNA-degrading endonuclease RelE of RelBE toxin-antitoxin system
MKIKISPHFEKKTKNLKKKYPLIKQDIISVINDLKQNPLSGTPMGNHRYKIRVKNSSTNKGKSGGYRVITYVKIKQYVLLVSIYSKSEQENILDEEIDQVIEDYESSNL